MSETSATQGEATVTTSADQEDFESDAVLRLREDLALELMVSRRNTTEVRVREVMSAPLPVAGPDAPAEELSRLLRGGHPAVLVRLADGEFAILTKFDLLQAMAP